MSEKEDAKKKKEAGEHQVEVVAKRSDLYDFLEALFAGTTQRPELIELRIVKGKNDEILGPMVKQYKFQPAEYKVDAAAPAKEKLVALSNEMVYRAQRDCDESNKPHVYALLASHFAREVNYYERYLMRLTPQGVHASKKGDGRSGSDDDEDDLSMKTRVDLRMIDREERMLQLYMASMEGIVDRQDRIAERQEKSYDTLRERYEGMLEITERARSLEDERRTKHEWNQVGIKLAERGGNLAIDLLPPFVNRLTGKALLPTKSTEEITLNRFFTKKADGGDLTDEQSDAVFGVYEDDAQGTTRCLREGIFTFPQAKLLWEVAFGQAPPDALDELFTEGSKLHVTGDQIMKLQGALTPEQILPIAALIQGRQSAKEKAAAAAATKK